MNNLSLIQQIIVWGIPVLFGITLHEVAHGWVANKLGDPTARLLGRVTINPLKHIDPLGTIVVPSLLFFTSGFIIGWAKPVPITWQNLKNKRRDIILVTLAGPGANLLMLLFWAFWIKAGYLFAPDPASYGQSISFMIGQAGVLINMMLLVFNLLPIPPLDGSRVVMTFLHGKAAYFYMQMERFGFLILILLMITGVLGWIMQPFFRLIINGLGYLI